MLNIAAKWLFVLSFGVDPFNEAALKELKALEGNWVVQAIDIQGLRYEPGEDARQIWTFKGRKWAYAPLQDEGEVVALDTTSNPKVIDLRGTLKGAKLFVREGIYKLEGDALTLCFYRGQDKSRPTSFDPPKEADIIIITLKRLKE